MMGFLCMRFGWGVTIDLHSLLHFCGYSIDLRYCSSIAYGESIRNSYELHLEGNGLNICCWETMSGLIKKIYSLMNSVDYFADLFL